MTFRRRLTLSYAIASVTSLSVMALAVCVVVAFLVTQRASLAAQHTVEDIRETARRDAALPSAAIVADVRGLHVSGEVIVRVPAPAPHHSLPPRDGRRGPPGIWNPAALLGLSPVIIALPGGGGVFVAPDLARIELRLRAVAAGFFVFELFAGIGSWALGRRIAARAVQPLDAIRGELERFGRGDFSPRPVAATNSVDLDALVRAYNSAAAQVAKAFAERQRVERDMRDFLADAGHQMRTPLTVISGSLDALSGPGARDEALREITYPLMHVQAARLRRLVERVMKLAGLERDEPALAEVVDVTDVAREVIGAVTAPAGAKAVLRGAGAFAYVWADPGEIYDAIANLVENAAKYGRGTAWIEVTNERGTVVVRVSDDGDGIAPSDRARLFQRFFRGQNTLGVEGTGLGLAIAKRAVERADGTLILESSDHQGSTFRIAIPAFQESAHQRSRVALG
jgi:two-component system OmpR family sensor kinase